jgi:hypothetical protein
MDDGTIFHISMKEEAPPFYHQQKQRIHPLRVLSLPPL